MKIESKYQVTDDYGVRGTLSFSGFTPSEIAKIFDQYQDATEKSDLGHFVKWTQLNHCVSLNKDIHVTYL